MKKIGNGLGDPRIFIPVDWDEFNKMYFSHRPVVVQYPTEHKMSAEFLSAMFSAMRVCMDGRRLTMIGEYGGSYMKRFNANMFIEALAGGKGSGKSDNVTTCSAALMYSRLPGERRGIDCVIDIYEADGLAFWDEWRWFCDIVSDTNGFDDDSLSSSSFAGNHSSSSSSSIWNCIKGCRMFPDRKILILWDNGFKPDVYSDFKERYDGKWAFIEYGREKRIVDEWFMENDSSLDPLFDMKLADPGLDMRKVCKYMSTNHHYRFREFAKFNNDKMAELFSKEALKEITT